MHHPPVSSLSNSPAQNFITDEFGIIRLRQQRHLSDPASYLAEATNSNAVVRLSRSSFMDFEQFHQALPWHQHLLATAANAGDSNNAVIVGHSAALWHGLWIFDHAPTEVELHRCPASRSFDTGVRHYDAPVTEAEETEVDGLLVTTVARTIIDIYRMHGPGAAFVTMCSALKQGLCTAEDVKATASKQDWKHRLTALDKVIENATGDHTYPLEAIAHAQVALTRFANVAPKVQQGSIHLNDGTILTVSNENCPLYDQAVAQTPDLSRPAHTERPSKATTISAADILSGNFLYSIASQHSTESDRFAPLIDRVKAELANMFF